MVRKQPYTLYVFVPVLFNVLESSFKRPSLVGESLVKPISVDQNTSNLFLLAILSHLYLQLSFKNNNASIRFQFSRLQHMIWRMEGRA